MPNYPNPTRLLQTWFADMLDTGPDGTFRRWLTSTPVDLHVVENLPTVVLTRYGGADGVVGLDDCNIDANVYCTGPDPMLAEDAALERAEDIRRAVRLWLVGTVLGDEGGPVVSRIRTISAPTIRPYDSRHQIRKAHYAFAMRLHSVV